MSFPIAPQPSLPGVDTNNAQTTYYGSNTSQNAQGSSTGTANSQVSNQNQYSADQQALQSQLAGQYGGLISGQSQIPAYFTAPQQVFDAFNTNFTKNVEPGIAAQFGAGSPQIGAQRSFGNQQLAAQLYQGGISNYLNSLGAANNFAMTPQGTIGSSNTANQGSNQYENDQGTMGIQSNQFGQGLLALLLGMLGGGI